MSVRHALKHGLAIGLLTLVHSAGPVNAMKIQEVKSPGGITAWLVQEHSVPLLALRFAFDGGSSQDPADKAGVANFMTSMLDEGAGDIDARTFQERMEELAFKMSFQYVDDSTIKPKDVTIQRTGNASVLRVSYDKVIPFIYNIAFLLHFEKSVPLKSAVGQ